MRQDSWIFKLTALAIIVGVLIYGSLYPWVFHVPVNGEGPVRALLKTWAVAPERGDLLANVVLYLPFGFFCVWAFPSGVRARWRIGVALLAGAIISVGVELAQYFDEGRVTSMGDVYTNVCGTGLGAAFELLVGRDIRVPMLREIRQRPFPAVLIVSWLGYRLYPYVPTIDLHKYWDALKPVVLHPQFTIYACFCYSVMWLTIGALLEAIARHKRSRWLFPLLAVGILFAKILIISQEVNPNEVVGMSAGFIIWCGLLQLRVRGRTLLVVVPLLVYVALWRLEPFQFGDTARPFGWIPFYSLLHGSLEVNTESYLEKVFYYGSLIWLMAEAGLPIFVTGIAVAALLFATSSAEIYLPVRSAEITDATMALIIAFFASLLTSKTDDFVVEEKSRSLP